MISAKFQADFETFYTAVQKSEVKLRDFESGSNKVAAALNRMTDTFSGRKVIQEATLMEQAIGGVEGISKLTARELEIAGAKAAEAADKMKRLGVEVPPGLQKLADAAKQADTNTATLGVSFTQLVGSMITAQAIIGAVKGTFGAMVGFLTDAVKASNDAEHATVQLVAALKAQGTATPGVVSAIQGYASALQQVTIYQDDAVEGAAALLVQVGNVMPRDMEKALEATTNLASGLGKDLTSAALLVAKAAEGNTGALKKAGVVIDETKAKSEGFGYVLDQITEKFGGQAAAIAGTYEGRLTQLANTWNNVEESIGRAITQNATVLDLLGRLNGVIDQNTGELKNNAQAMNLISDAVILTVRGFGLVAQGLDLLQTGAAGFVVTMRGGAQALGNIGIVALEAAKGLAIMQGNFLGFQQADRGVIALKNAVKELGDRNIETTQHSIAFGNILQGIGAKADALAADLDKTRGQTVALATATDKGAGAWDRQTTAVGAGADALKKAKDDAKRYEEAHAKVVEKVRELEVIMPGLRNAVGELDTTELKSIGTHLQNVDALKKLSDTLRALQRDDFAAVTRGLENIGTKTADIDILKDHLKALGTEAKSFGDTMLSALGSLPGLFQQAFLGGGGVGGALKGIAVQLGTDFGKTLLAGIKAATAAGTSAFTGVTAKAAAATGAVAGLGAAMSGASGKAAAASAAMAGVGVATATIAAAAASTAGVTTAAVGGAVALGAATAGIGLAAVGAYFAVKHFLNDTEKKINPVRQGFIDAAGGLDALNQKAVTAGVSLDALLGAKNKDQLQKAVDDLSAAFDVFAGKLRTAYDGLGTLTGQLTGLTSLSPGIESALDGLFNVDNLDDFNAGLLNVSGLLTGEAAKQKELNDLVSKYGLSWTDASAAFKQSKIDQISGTLISDFNNLKGIFPDLNIVMKGAFGDAVESFVKDAKKAGVEVPKNMIPVLQTAIDAGRLFDDSGKKIGNLSDLGLTFGGTMEDVQKTIANVLGKLLEFLEKHLAPGFTDTAKAASGIKGELDKLPTEKTIHIGFDVDTPPGWRSGDQYHQGGVVGRYHTGGVVAPAKILPFLPRAHRGLAVDEVPIVALRGEGILNRGAMARIGGGAGLRAFNQGGGATSVRAGDVYVAIVDGQPRRLTQAEFDQIQQQFGAKRFRIPADAIMQRVG